MNKVKCNCGLVCNFKTSNDDGLCNYCHNMGHG
jgi:hypothetical protein